MSSEKEQTNATAPTEAASGALNPTMLPTRQEMVGQTLNDRYLVERELGRGGFSVVYLARDRQLHNKPVVIKVLLEEAYRNDWVVNKFHQEIEALSRLDHPGIISITDTGQLPGSQPFIVMQYVEGYTLRSIIRPEGIALERAAELIKQTGRALSAAHDKSIYHRDLKPENIMLQNLGAGDEQVKIIDFGIAKVKDSVVAPSTSTTMTAGTIAYMSPEQLSNRPVTAATDIYALGVIAYEIVAGRRPFNPETIFELLEMQRGGVRVNPKDLRPSLPEEAQAVILKALAFEPRDRFRRARDFGDVLHRALTTGSDTLKMEPKRQPAPTVLANSQAPAMETPTAPAAPPVKTIRAQSPPPPISGSTPAADSFDAARRSDYSAASSRPPQRKINPALIIISALLLAGIIILALWYSIRPQTGSKTEPESTETSGAPAVERTLNYWLTVQKMRDGKPYQEPFESSGQEIFESGWKFRMNISSPQSGYLYLLDEGPKSGGASAYYVLFPDPEVNSGASQVKAEQKIQTDWMIFDPHEGTEKFWMVWADGPVKELEDVKGVVNPKDKGEIKDPSKSKAVSDFLAAHSSSSPEVEKDRVKKQTIVKAKGDVLASLIELEHH